jgi:carbamoyltransferase
MARFAHRETGLSRLCLAGGVALNCVGNGRILREGPFEDLWIQPASGDAGGSLGVALALWHRYLGKPRVSAERAGRWQPSRRRSGNSDPASLNPHKTELPPYDDGMKTALLGPAFSELEIDAWLKEHGLSARRFDRRELPAEVARLLADNKVIGLFQGRMEFGPRALGARSIIADARSRTMQSVLNLKIKFRESFRPFAPAVLREAVGDWFECDEESPYMLLVAGVKPSRRLPAADDGLWGIDKLKVPRSEIPAVTHVDYSARIQTVRREANPLYYDIIRAFYGLTGCPVIVNTSFNVRDEPIVCTIDDAYRCYMKTEMDALVLESFLLEKPARA